MSPECRCATLLLLALAGACTATSVEPAPSDDAERPDAGEVPDAGEPVFAASAKGRVRFKGAERLRNDLAQALELDPAEVCQELGQYDCVDFVHTVALGGVEPYELGVVEPLDETTATTPLAVERVALAACVRRVDRDLSGDVDAVLFGGLPLDGDRLRSVDDPAVAEAIARLYRRALLREPTEAEQQHLRRSYTELEGDNEPRPARDWAVLTCFSVLTSLEGLFY